MTRTGGHDTDNIATVHIRIANSVVDEHTKKDENKARTRAGRAGNS